MKKQSKNETKKILFEFFRHFFKFHAATADNALIWVITPASLPNSQGSLF